MKRLIVARLALALVLAGSVGCGALAVWSASEKAPSAQRTPAAARADELFWRTLHTGAYERIPDALVALKAAYLADPNDATTAAHIGFLHIWRLSERARLGTGVGPGITDDAVLARKYFEEAVRLHPGEARYLGFYASLLMAEGAIHKDEKLMRRGYFTMKDAVAAWPEFNEFTLGYVTASQPHDSARFREGLEAMWRNLDVCVGERVDRNYPDYARFMRLETPAGAQARVLELVDRAPQLRGLLPELRRHAGEGGRAPARGGHVRQRAPRRGVFDLALQGPPRRPHCQRHPERGGLPAPGPTGGRAHHDGAVAVQLHGLPPGVTGRGRRRASAPGEGFSSGDRVDHESAAAPGPAGPRSPRRAPAGTSRRPRRPRPCPWPR